MPKLTVEEFGVFEVPKGKRLLNAMIGECGVDQLHACGDGREVAARTCGIHSCSECLFATLSAIVLTQEVLTLQVGIGGAMIVLAAALSALENKDAH